MKKLLALLFVLTFTLASCSDDDEDNKNSSIVGTWELQSIKIKEVKTSSDEATQSIKDMLARDKHVETFVFESEGRFTWFSGVETESGTYSLKRTTLTLTHENGSLSYDNTQLSDDMLSFDTDHTENLQDWQEGVVVSKVIVTLTFKKK